MRLQAFALQKNRQTTDIDSNLQCVDLKYSSIRIIFRISEEEGAELSFRGIISGKCLDL
jgi:hypothetical protein